MASIRTHCEDCGDLELTSEDVIVRVCLDNQSGSYNFICPKCKGHVSKPAEPRIVELLVVSGCRVQSWHLPAEMKEAHYGGPVIEVDELIDVHELLADEAAFSEELRKLSSE